MQQTVALESNGPGEGLLRGFWTPQNNNKYIYIYIFVLVSKGRLRYVDDPGEAMARRGPTSMPFDRVALPGRG
jgi:hypothetical protein